MNLNSRHFETDNLILSNFYGFYILLVSTNVQRDYQHLNIYLGSQHENSVENRTKTGVRGFQIE